MPTSFSWDRAFYTSDGFLADDELSRMIEGGGELHKIDELESLEAKLFQEIEASTRKATRTSTVKDSSSRLSSGKKDSQPKKVTGAGGPHRNATIKTPTPPTRSSPSSSGSPVNTVKSPPRRTTGSKTGKGNADSPSKTPPVITTKSKVAPVNTRVSRTSPASPVSPRSPGSPSSTFSVTQWSKRDGSASKPAVGLKIKSPPVTSHPSSHSGRLNSPSSLTTPRLSESSSCKADQRSRPRGTKGSPVHNISKPALKNHPIGQTLDPTRKQPAKTVATVAAANTGLKPSSPKTKKPSSPKAKASLENIFIISPEILDLKGKLNALKMEIDMHKDRCSKMARAERGEGNLKTPLAIRECSL